MAFVSIPGIQGKVFLPEKGCRHAKHPCRDCFDCQRCSEDRCRVCRRPDEAGSAPANRQDGDDDGGAGGGQGLCPDSAR